MDKNKEMNVDVKKIVKILMGTVQWIIWVLLTALCAFSSVHGEMFTFNSFGAFTITMILFPFLLLGGLYGSFFSYISFISGKRAIINTDTPIPRISSILMMIAVILELILVFLKFLCTSLFS